MDDVKGNRKRSPTVEEGPLPPKQSAVEAICVWCRQTKRLLPGKTFCSTCCEKGRECQSCHQPKPERYYSEEVDHCTACINKQQHQAGWGKKTALDKALTTTTLKPDETTEQDPLIFFKDSNPETARTIQEALET